MSEKKVVDLMAALEESLARAKEERQAKLKAQAEEAETLKDQAWDGLP